MSKRYERRLSLSSEIIIEFATEQDGTFKFQGRNAREVPGSNKGKNKRTYTASESDAHPIERVVIHGNGDHPSIDTKTEVKNKMGGTKFEHHILLTHDRVEVSFLENHYAVMPPIYELETRLARVEVMYLESFLMLAEEAKELKKIQREIFSTD